MPRSLVNLIDEIGLDSRVNTLEGAASTVKNYIPNATFNSNTSPVPGWSLFNTALTNKIPTGAITAGSSIGTFVISPTNPIAGTYSLLVEDFSTTWPVGHGFISNVFTIDVEDKAKVLSFSFSYRDGAQGTGDKLIWAGNNTNTLAVYIYDVTNSSWIQPAGVYNLTQGIGTGLCSGTFQTTSNSTQYRFAVLAINESTTTFSVQFDSFQLGPQKIAAGAAVSDWQSYTPTITNFGPVGSVAVEAYYRRVGGNLEVNIDFTQTANFSSSTGLINVNLIGGLGLNIDTTKLAENGSTEDNYGHVSGTVYGVGYSGGQTYVGRMDMTAASKTSVTLYGDSGSLSWNTTSSSPATWAVSTLNSIRIHASVPIVGWSSNTVMSQDTDTRVVSAFGTKTSGTHTSTGNWQDVTSFDSSSTSTHANFNTTTGVYTVAVSGDYLVSANAGFSTNSTGFRGIRILKTGGGSTGIGVFVSPVSGGQTNIATSGIVRGLVAGDILYMQAYQSSGGNLNYATSTDVTTNLSISRISGPATIAASETVAFSANTSTSSVANGSLDTMKVIIMSSVAVDTHAAYNVSTGAYTIPVSGKYLINGNGAVNATLVHFRFGFSVDNTSNFTALDQTYAETAGVIEPASFSSIMHLNAGQVIRFGVSHGSGSPVSMLSDARFNFVSIARIGN